MKRTILAAGAALALLLSGCMPMQTTNPAGGDSAPAASSQEETQQSGLFRQNQTEQESTATELQVNVNGSVETVQVTVYSGSGYTIAVPDTWARSDREPSWSPEENSDVSLTVRYYSGKKTAKAAAAFQRAQKDYLFEAVNETTLTGAGQATQLRGTQQATAEGSTEEGGAARSLVAYFVETNDGCYALLLECPTEDTARFGGYLGAMANSFALVQQQSKTPGMLNQSQNQK